MLTAFVRFSIERRGVVLACAVILTVYGIYRLSGAGLDIFPEFSPQQVVVQTEAPGFTAEQVEIRVSQVLENALGGLIDLDHIRSESIQGLSILTLVFKEHSDTYRNRNQVNERLAGVRARLPSNALEPVIAPLSSSSATVRTIGLTAAGDDVSRLRDLTRSVVVPRLLGVSGVADVNVFGGEHRALIVTPVAAALERHRLGYDDLLSALRAAGISPGLGVIETPNQQIAITRADRPFGPDDLAAMPLGLRRTPGLTIGDVAQTSWGALPRISAAQIGGQPAVVMMVIGQLGANTLSVSRALETTLADLAPVLAQRGVTLHQRLFVPADYITRAITDIGRHLLIGGGLVLAVLLIGLYDWRSALISALAIPLSLLTAALVLIETGVNLNVLVIGGLAIALGEVVDDAIIDTENIFRRLRTAPAGTSFEAVALSASLEVRSSVVYATFIVALVFVPLLLLGGVSGRLFAPLGLAYILAVLASLLVAISVTPALCVSLLAGRSARAEAPVFALINPAYASLVRSLARRPWRAVAAGVGCVLFVLAVLPGFGARFLPDLREGHFIVHTTALPGTALDESIRLGTRLSERFAEIDGVRSVSQWAGRAERGADTYGSHYSEYEVALETLDGRGQQRVLEALRDILRHQPGISFEANTFLTERIDETISGYTAPVVVNIFGRDLDTIDRIAAEVAEHTRRTPGARNVSIRAAHPTPNVTIALDSAALTHHGVTAAQALAAVRAAHGGAAVSEFHEGNLVVPIAIRLSASTRSELAGLKDLPVMHGASGPIRLGQLATIVQSAGRYNILHRNGQRLQVVTAAVVGRDLQGFLNDLRGRVLSQVSFPEAVHVEFTGAAVEQAAARRALIVNALVCSLGVLVLIYMAVERLRYLVLILFNVPFSLVGGVVAVMLSGGIVSVGSVVGFVTLFGITVRNSIMLVSHYDHLVRIEGAQWNIETVVRGARERLPAILMTALVTALAMLPLTIDSDNAGREIMGPMASIIIGGLMSSTLLNLLVMPALLHRFGRFSA